MEILIRLAQDEDIPALKKLIPASARELSQGYYTEQQIDSAIQYIFWVDTQLITDRTYYVAESGGEIVGCGGWSKRKTLFGGDQMKAEADPLLDPLTEAGRIRAFFIHPQWARKGIGRRIIQDCEEAAKVDGFTRMELVATLPGEPLYAAMGYVVTRRFDQTVADGTGIPLAHMRKSLAEETSGDKISEPVVFISRNRVKEGRAAEFRQHYQGSLAPILAGKPGTLVQLAYEDEAAGEVTVVRLFPSAEALDQQIQGADERSKKTYEFIEPVSIEIYGAPSPATLEKMKKIAGSGVMVKISPGFLGGFIRSFETKIRQKNIIQSEGENHGSAV